jgi:hypothetical protein
MVYAQLMTCQASASSLNAQECVHERAEGRPEALDLLGIDVKRTKWCHLISGRQRRK